MLHALAVFALVVWLLAFVQTLVNLRLTPRLTADARPRVMPLVSIVIPARNEAHVIERSVRAFLAQDYDNFEVIVVNDRSTDGTGEIARSIVDRRLRVIDGMETPAGWLGKTWALQQGAERARGDLLLIVDADLIYAPPAIRAAVAYLEGSESGLIALLPHFEMPTFAEQVAMPMLGFFVFSGMPVWYSNRSKRLGVAIGGGAGNLIRKEILGAVGGFARLKDAVVDDVGLARLARKHGYATRAVRADDLLTVRMYDSARAIVDGFTKNAFFAVGRNFAGGMLLLVLIVILHLLPYVLAFARDWVAIATVILISITRIAIFRSIRYPLLNAIFLHPLMVSFWFYIFLRSIWFTGVRRQVRWRGRVYDREPTPFGSER
ncbi:MAG TPA: glycosyltransferase [Thermoanaerobaculia bacterium]|nr:glycosyltransferase [Thermoanaerobaculia bacterium]